MKISTFFKPLSFVPALALMYMIFSFSSQPAESSSSLSFRVSRKIVQAVDTVAQKNWDDSQIDAHADRIHSFVRKGAHITEYFLLAVAISFPLYVYGVRGILLMLLAGIICVGYACTDEYHQSMVSGRAASFRDVMIDSIGIFFGVILTRLLGWSGRMAITGPIYERRQNKKQQELDKREEELLKREEALRREEYYLRHRRQGIRRRTGQAAQANPNPAVRRDPYAALGASASPDPALRQGPYPAQGASASPDPAAQDDLMGRTRVIGTKHEVDDRTRVYRTEEEQRRMDEAYHRQVYERRRVQSQELLEDSTSDQLSEDLPFSSLFLGRKKKE